MKKIQQDFLTAVPRWSYNVLNAQCVKNENSQQI